MPTPNLTESAETQIDHPTPTGVEPTVAVFDESMLIPALETTSDPGPPNLEANTNIPAIAVRLARFLGVDRAIGFTVLARGWSSLAGVGSLVLIARFLTPAEQGFYYNFYALVALQIIFELGFSFVILQTASHEAAHLHFAEDGTVTGPERELCRLSSVLQKSLRWYTIAAVLMALTLMPTGVMFFRHVANKPGNGGVHFVFPWLLVVIASSCTFQIDPIFSFLEGCGFVPQVARTRFRQSVLSTLLGWTAFICHRGLFAPGFFIFGQAIAGGYFIFTKRKLLLGLLRHASSKFRIHWGNEVWPFQWRIAVSWLAGYLTSQLFVPVITSARGPIEGGRLGMSLTVCATLTTMSVSWMNTKASPFGQMISRKEYRKLDQIFVRTLIQSAGAAILACTFVWLAIEWLAIRGVTLHHVLLASRLLPPVPLAMLFFGTICNVIVIAEALYLRAHKQEKFMVNSIVGAVYALPVALVIGRLQSPYGGAWGIAAAYAVGSLIIGIGFGSYTFFKWRRIWHAD